MWNYLCLILVTTDTLVIFILNYIMMVYKLRINPAKLVEYGLCLEPNNIPRQNLFPVGGGGL